jgi:hypothetical protein
MTSDAVHPIGSLPQGDVRRLARETTWPGAAEPFGAYLFAMDEPGADLARHLEHAVFLETFGNTPGLLASEYGRYEPGSLFICVVDHRRSVPAGCMRVLTPSPAGFKSLDDIEPVWGRSAQELIDGTGLALDPARTWDIATLAVAEEYRGNAAGGLVTMGLYQTLTLAAFHCGIDWFIAILDMPVFRIIRWKLRMIFAGYEGIGPRPYLGSVASLPAWCDVSAAERRLAEQDPDLHAVLVRGVGLEPALRPVDLTAADEFVVGPRRAATADRVSW